MLKNSVRKSCKMDKILMIYSLFLYILLTLYPLYGNLNPVRMMARTAVRFVFFSFLVFPGGELSYRSGNGSHRTSEKPGAEQEECVC